MKNVVSLATVERERESYTLVNKSVEALSCPKNKNYIRNIEKDSYIKHTKVGFL